MLKGKCDTLPCFHVNIANRVAIASCIMNCIGRNGDRLLYTLLSFSHIYMKRCYKKDGSPGGQEATHFLSLYMHSLPSILCRVLFIGSGPWPALKWTHFSVFIHWVFQCSVIIWVCLMLVMIVYMVWSVVYEPCERNVYFLWMAMHFTYSGDKRSYQEGIHTYNYGIVVSNLTPIFTNKSILLLYLCGGLGKQVKFWQNSI